MRLSELLEKIAVENSTIPDIEVNGIAYDSRKVERGNVFVCIKGYQTDGHKYINSAVQNGAAAIIACDPVEADVPVLYTHDTRMALALMSKAYFREPLKNIGLIGVTGTNGKTTVTYLIKEILEKQGKKVGLIGTNKNMIGNKILPSERTTPESYELYKLFADMAADGADYVVMEVSSHALELNRVGGCEFLAAVFTNLTQDHLDFHGDMESYFKAKCKLFTMCKSAVINTDDTYGARIASLCKVPVRTYALDREADMRAESVSVSAKGVTYTIEEGDSAIDVEVPIPGKFSVYNSLAAICAAECAKIDAETSAKALSGVCGVTGRAEVVPTNTDYTVMIDYAHTPDGLENIISTVNEFKTARVITVFGCGGDRDRTKRPLMGKTAGELSDFVIVTSDNPRTENPSAIIDDIMPGVLESGCEYARIENREEAIHYALNMAKKGDVILLAGKGHETYQILNEGTIHFDEREIVAKLLDK